LLERAVKAALGAFGVAVIVPVDIGVIVGPVVGDGEKRGGFDAEAFLIAAARAADVFEAVGVRHGEHPFSVDG
jgi:hypothetical protein